MVTGPTNRGIKTLFGWLIGAADTVACYDNDQSNRAEEGALNALFLAFFEVQVVEIVDNLDGEVVVLR